MSAVDRWRSVANAMTFRPAWPWPMRIIVDMDLRDGLSICAQLTAPCVVTGESQIVHHMEHIPLLMAEGATHADIVRHAHRLLKAAVEHEFDECLLLDGKQLRDPHASEGAFLDELRRSA